MVGQGEMLLTVNMNVSEILATFEAILMKKQTIQGLESSQIICGQSLDDYSSTIRHTKFECLNTLPMIYQRLGSLALPFVTNKLPLAAK